MKERFECNFEIKSEDITEDGIFEGYGSTFGGSPDSYGDVIQNGAFRESLDKGGRNGYGVAMLWQHNSAMVPGKWLSLEENAKGLKVKGQLALNTQLGKDTYELLKMKAIQGLSIGFTPVETDDDKNKRVRVIKKVNLWEISLVTFPANTRAKINSVKSFDEARTEREVEDLLRESGVSRSVAIKVAAMCKPYLRELGIKEKEAEADNSCENLSDVLEILQKTNMKLN